MAIVTRRYQFVGVPNANLAKYVAASAAQNASFPGAVQDIDIDNAIPDAITSLDAYMESLGFVFDASASGPSLLGEVGAFTRQQYNEPSALAYAANINVDAQLSTLYTVTLSGVTAQLNDPSNLVAGMNLTFLVTQDGTGGRALTFGANYSFGAAGAPDLTTSAAGVIDVISCLAVSPTKLVCTSLRGY
jgi:hypothetical protein